MRQLAAEGEAKPKPIPLAKPKPKPKPQVQHPLPPLPPPHPLTATKSAKAVKPEAVVEDDEEYELEQLRGEVQVLSASLGAQRGAKARAEAKVVAQEAKVDAPSAQGEEEREGWAATLLETARQKVRDVEDNIH